MSTTMPAEAFPPGEYLRDELESRGWTQAEFAEILGRSVRLVNEIIAGKRSVTPETAVALGAALGTSPVFWMNLDAAYQLWRVAQGSGAANERIAREARLRGRFPVRELVRRGWVQGSENTEVLEGRVLKFFNLSTIAETPRFLHAAKRSTEGQVESVEQVAWLTRVKQIAEAMVVPAYSEGTLKGALLDLHTLAAASEEIRSVPKILAQAGIRFAVVEPLPGSKIDAACFWVGEGGTSPVIGMSLRFDRIDNFWFVLRHEIEHVLRGHGKKVPIVDDSLCDAEPTESAAIPPQQEQVANEAAAEFCVPRIQLDDFVARVRPLYSDSRIIGFARTIGVHPGLVVGQLQRREGRYDIFRRFLVKVRHIITATAITDGYGAAVPPQTA